MHLLRYIFLSPLLLLPTLLQADERRPWEDYWEALFAMEDEEIAEGSGSMEDIYDLLYELEEHPIDINNTTREELELLPFLTARHVEDICEYLYYNKGMRSKSELMLIGTLDYNRRKLMECFVYVGEMKEKVSLPSMKELFENGLHRLTAMGNIPFYKREGYRNGYLGYEYKHWLRYDYTYGKHLRAGFIGSQDAGEPFFGDANTLGYDYYSAFVQLKNIGKLENVIVGRYRASFGMGLVLNTGFSLGKQSTLATLGRTFNGFRVHSSRSEQGYFRGAATTIRLGESIKASVFASHRAIDATLNKDDGTIATILTDGYHRTPTEMSKKGNAHATAGGVNMRYRNDVLHVGATAVYTHFDRRLKPKSANTTYRRYYASGNNLMNIGVDYGLRHDAFYLSGETAIDRNGYVATINSITLNISDDIEGVLLHRYYSHRYTSLYANSFSDGSRINNEHGIYGGVKWHLSRQWELSAYSDFAYFYWPKYLISRTSWASDNMITTSFRPNDEWTFDARYRLHIRQRDNETKQGLINKADHRVRFSASYHGASPWNGKTSVDLSLTDFKQTDRGAMISQTLGYTSGWLKMGAGIKYFHTDSYDARLYSSEPGLPYSFYFPAYYGHGMRYSITARADISRQLRATAKLGITNYFDRNAISSGLQRIEGSSTTDLEMMLQWNF